MLSTNGAASHLQMGQCLKLPLIRKWVAHLQMGNLIADLEWFWPICRLVTSANGFQHQHFKVGSYKSSNTFSTLTLIKMLDLNLQSCSTRLKSGQVEQASAVGTCLLGGSRGMPPRKIFSLKNYKWSNLSLFSVKNALSFWIFYSTFIRQFHKYSSNRYTEQCQFSLFQK